ncbi:MAG TPA: hypothetical protein VLK82_06150 [Candidatus Tectomicrobia bacterium]|nr:hypothetical protein [Candidatus Tectomicrobia bacterium]
MRRRRHARGSIIRSAMLCIGIVLSLGVYDRIWAALGSFAPPSHVVAEVNPDLYKYEIQRIGIIGFVNHSSTPDAGLRLASFFYTELDSHRRYEVTPPLLLDEETELAFTRTAQAAPEDERPGRLRQFVREWLGRIWPSSEEPPEASMSQTPPAAGVPTQGQRPLDAVLTGIITRYDDRQGNALLVDHPASVAYEAYLISARDGEILWRARFDETQRPLFDNLLLAGRFLKGGAIWQTNDTLARIGLERVVKTFPGIAPQPLP